MTREELIEKIKSIAFDINKDVFEKYMMRMYNSFNNSFVDETILINQTNLNSFSSNYQGAEYDPLVYDNDGNKLCYME